MAVRRDRIQLDVEINGQKAGRTYRELIKDARNLKRELLELTPGTDAFVRKSRELKRVNDRLKDIRENTRGVGKGFRDASGFASKFRSVLKTVGPAIIGALALDRLGDAIQGFFRVTQAVDAFDIKAKTVFGDYKELVEAFAEQNAQALGLTRSEFLGAATAIGDLLVPMGFQRKEAAQLSSELVNLSGALSEWSGGQRTAQEVSQVLGKALLGEREQLKELGISIREADVQARLAEEGLDGLTGEAEQQAKALVTLTLVQERSADAQRQFQEGTNELIRSKNTLRARISEIRDRLATALVPAFTAGFKALNQLLTGVISFGMALKEVPAFIRENRVTIGALITALVTLNATALITQARTLAVATANRAAAIATNAQTIAQRLLNTAMRANPVGVVITAITLLVAAFDQAYRRSENFRASIKGLGALAREVFAIIKEAVQAFADGFNSILEGDFKEGFTKIAEGLHKSNPIGIAIGEGGRLKKAFLDGYEKEKGVADATKKEVEDAAKDENVKKAAQDVGQAGADQLLEKFKQALNDKDKGVSAETRKAFEKATQDLIRETNELLDAADPILQRLQIRPELSLPPQAPPDTDPDLTERQVDFGIIEEANERELELLREKFLRARLAKEEYEQQRREQELQSAQQRLAILEELGLTETQQFRDLQLEKLKIQKEINENRLENEVRLQQAQQEIQSQGLKATGNLFGSVASLLKEDEQNRKKHADAIKTFEVARVQVGLFSEIQAIWEYANKNPANALFPGAAQLIAGLKTAAAIARATQAINKISSAKFDRGGHTGDGFFADDSGHKVAGVVHANEWVAPETMVKNPQVAPIIQQLEQLRLRGFQTGGFTSVNTTPVIDSINIPGLNQADALNRDDFMMLINEVSALRNDIKQQSKQQRAYVVHQDILDADEERNEIENLSSI